MVGVDGGGSALARRRLGAQTGDAARFLYERGAGGSAAIFVLIALVTPNQFSIALGDTVITPIRLSLIVLFVPTVLAVFTKLKMKLFLHDLFYIGFAGWTVLCILINRGFGGGLQSAGQFFLETAVLYFVIQTSVDSMPKFTRVVKFLFGVILVLLLLSPIEIILKHHFIQDVANMLVGLDYPVPLIAGERFGILRVTSLFAHPILFGIFCAAPIGMVWYAERSIGAAIGKVAVLTVATFLSLSTAPMLVALVQFGCIGLETVTRGLKNRFRILMGCLGVVLTVVHFGAARGLFGIVLLLALNPATAYYRREIWNNGIDDVIRNPIFGIIPETWTRLFWMTPSIDNYWLYQAMLGGVPSVVCLFLAIVFIMVKVFRRSPADVSRGLDAARRGWAFAIVGMVMCGGTVHFFDKIQPYFSLMIAMGGALVRMSLVDPAPDGRTDAGAPAVPQRRSLLSDPA